ncbi:MAG: Ig-like domain-containing protein [Gemmatimonadota bacterium]|nr:Ig-like domain-containing protein [Gemmatimonadota bacterium]
MAACDESLQGGETLPLEGRVGVQIVPVTAQSLLAQVGVQLDTPLQVRVVDEVGRPVGSAVVRYGVLAGAGIFSADSTLTDDQGFTQVLFRPLTTGTVIVEAAIERPGGTDRVQFTIQVLADPTVADDLIRISGSGQSARIGSVLPEPMVVRVLNPDGVPVEGHPVTFTLETSKGDAAGVADSPDGPFTNQVAVLTDASGFARTFMKLGTEAGLHTATASIVTGTGATASSETVTFNAAALASDRVADLIAISGETQTVVIDTLHEEDSPDFRGTDPNPFVVRAVDEFGNPVSGTTITWFVSDGTGTIAASTTTTDANGISTNLLIDPSAGRNAVVAVAGRADPVTFEVTGEVLEPPEEEGDGGDGGGGGA